MGRRSRSPNYPRLSLADAIERVSKLYKKEGTHKTTREAVAEGLDYTSLNGASLGMISTLKQYGLLEEDADGIRVSQDTVALVMLPAGDHERVEALQRSAFAPRLFSELREEYGETLPSDVSLRYALIKKGYSEKASGEVIRAYRDTLELVSEESADYTDADAEDRQGSEPPMTQPTAGQQISASRSHGTFVDAGAPRGSGEAAVLQFRISNTSEARIELMGDITQESIERLMKILDVQKFVFPSEEQSAVEQTTDQPAIEPPTTD